MKQLNLAEAEAKLSHLVDQAARGRGVIIAKSGIPMAKLVPLDDEETQKFKFGTLKGVLTADLVRAIEAPLPEHVLDDDEWLIEFRLGRPFACDLDQRFCGDAEPLVQATDHRERQGALAGQHLIDAVATADEGHQVARREPVLLHMILDCLHRVGQLERIAFRLPGFDQRDKQVEPIALERVAFRVHQALDLLEGAPIIAMGSDRFDFHVFHSRSSCSGTRSSICTSRHRASLA